jgi:antitoxin (DNA-binding transcriptional repressor) of toxin-antitoxin stability system
VIKLNVHEAKTHLSRYLSRVEAGETLILCRHNKPIAELRPIKPKVKKKRVFDVYKGFGVSPAFFEPMPEDESRLWEDPDDEDGRSGSDLVAAMQASPHKDIDLDVVRTPMPVRDAPL